MRIIPTMSRFGTKILMLFLIAFASTRCNRSRDGRGYRPQKAKRMTIHRMIQCTGTVKAQVGAEVKVGARVSGRVERLFVRAGQAVKKDEVVAYIERAELKAKLDVAKADLAVAKRQLYAILATSPKEIAKAKAAVEESKAEVKLGSLTFERQKALGKEGYTSQDSLDTARKSYEVAVARLSSAKQQISYLNAKRSTDLAVAQAQVTRAKAALAAAAINLEYATVRAPIAGVVGSVSTQEGETVAASFNAPVFISIIDLNRLQVDASVDETDIGVVKIGQRATFTVDAFPDRVFEGKVRAIQPQATIQQDVVYYIVEMDITSEYKGLLRPQMTANVLIRVGVRKNVVAVPGGSVRRLPDGKTVVTIPGPKGKPVFKPVKVGWTESGWTEIVRGIKPGDPVLVPQIKAKRRMGMRPMRR